MTASETVQHPVGRVADFAEGKFRIFELDGRSVGVVSVGGSFHAVLNVCPHALAPICAGKLRGTSLPSRPGEVPEFGLEGRILVCPWHHYEFDLGNNGRAVFTDYRARVRLFPVHVRDGQVSVELPKRAELNERPARVAGAA
jgi:nitrite reductase/ring-hydroxylating ferredoxin subunit